MFWTDGVQANERLQGSFVLFNDKCVLIERVLAEENPVLARVITYPEMKRDTLDLSNEGFRNFRVLPPTGWVNCKVAKTALYLSRRPRRSRQHGLSNDSVTTSEFLAEGRVVHGEYSYESIVQDEGYSLACKNDFPSLEDVLLYIREGSSLAISSLYSVFRDNTGIRHLCRKTDKIGLFFGTDSILLSKKFGFLKEELQECPEITIKDIKEF